jgi:regulator of nucleoside diphosphate kinase
MATNAMIRLTEQDYTRLKRVLHGQSHGGQELETLEAILDLARVVRPDLVPEDVVTMNSRVRFRDVASGEEGTVTVSYPSAAEPSSGRISVLSPVGAALIGAAEGQELELPLPHGQTRRIRIESVLYQPEAQGDFAL